MATTADPKPGRRHAAGPPGRRTPRPRRAGRSATCGSLASGKRKPAPAKLDNPLREGLRLERVPDPCVRRPVRGDRRPRPPQGHAGALPAVADEPPAPRVHARRGRPPAVRRRVVPRRRSGASLDDVLAGRRSSRRSGPSSSSRIVYHQGDFADADAFDRLADRLDEIDAEHGTRGNRLFYLATQPSAFTGGRRPARPGRPRPRASTAAAGAGSSSRSRSGATSTRPSGSTARSRKVFRESQVYRIDHYLGKETVRNLLVFRFGNGIFEPLWNRRYVDHVQITVAESIGVETPRRLLRGDRRQSGTSSRTTCCSC